MTASMSSLPARLLVESGQQGAHSEYHRKTGIGHLLGVFLWAVSLKQKSQFPWDALSKQLFLLAPSSGPFRTRANKASP